MDVQLCIFDWDGITLIQQPQVLREYVDKLRDLYVNPRVTEVEILNVLIA